MIWKAQKKFFKNEKDEDLREMAKMESSEIEAQMPAIEEKLKTSSSSKRSFR